MTLGGVAALIVAIALFILVLMLSLPLLKLGRLIDETRIGVRMLSHETTPLIREVTTTVTETNAQLGKVDVITTNVASATTNVSALTSLFAATLGSPIIRVAAFTYGVRQAVAGRSAKRRSSGRRR